MLVTDLRQKLLTEEQINTHIFVIDGVETDHIVKIKHHPHATDKEKKFSIKSTTLDNETMPFNKLKKTPGHHDESSDEDSMEDEDKENLAPPHVNCFIIDGQVGDLLLIAATEGFVMLDSYY